MKRFSLGCLLCLCLLALVESLDALRARHNEPSADDWQTVAAVVRSEFRSGDLITFAPVWLDPVGRHHLGDLMPAEMIGRADADRYRRIWEISLGSARDPDAARADLVRDTTQGRLHMRLLHRRGVATVLYDFTARLDQARVTQRRPERRDEIPCYLDAQDGDDGRRCTSSHVGRRTLEIDYRPRRGVLVPLDNALVTRLDYDGVVLGQSLVGYTGLHDYFARKNAAGLVDFAVYIDDVAVYRGQIGNDDAWRRFTVATPMFAGRRCRIRFEISAAHAAWRNFGFHVEVRA